MVGRLSLITCVVVAAYLIVASKSCADYLRLCCFSRFYVMWRVTCCVNYALMLCFTRCTCEVYGFGMSFIMEVPKSAFFAGLWNSLKQSHGGYFTNYLLYYYISSKILLINNESQYFNIIFLSLFLGKNIGPKNIST